MNNSNVTRAKCRKHGKQRLIRFLKSYPIYNADGVAVNYEYECMPDSECSTDKFAAALTEGSSTVSSTGNQMQAPQQLIEGMKAAAAERTQQPQSGQQQPPQIGGGGAGGAKSRYYDLSKKVDEVNRKVCYHCGLDDHERNNCPNKLCWSCHEPFGDGGKEAENSHECAPLDEPSPLFHWLPKEHRGVTEEDLAEVECVVCGELGHFDCRPSPSAIGVPTKELSCAACATTGHTAFQCPHIQPEKWLMHYRRQFPALIASLNIPGLFNRREGGGGGGGGGFGGEPRPRGPGGFADRQQYGGGNGQYDRRRPREDEGYGGGDDAYRQNASRHHNHHHSGSSGGGRGGGNDGGHHRHSGHHHHHRREGGGGGGSRYEDDRQSHHNDSHHHHHRRDRGEDGGGHRRHSSGGHHHHHHGREQQRKY